MPIRPWREQLNNSAMFLFYLPPRVLPAPLNPPWSILWRSQAARRILVHRVIAVRRILVISPESSLHAHKAVLVFARARMCDHLSLVAPPNAHWESLRFLPYSSSIYREICWAYVRRATFLLFWYNFIDGPMRLGSQMSFGLVEIWTPFNPKKFWWINLWSMYPPYDIL